MLLSRRNILKGLAGLLGVSSLGAGLATANTTQYKIPQPEHSVSKNYKVGDFVIFNPLSGYLDKTPFVGKIEEVAHAVYSPKNKSEPSESFNVFFVTRASHKNRTSKPRYYALDYELSPFPFKVGDLIKWKSHVHGSYWQIMMIGSYYIHMKMRYGSVGYSMKLEDALKKLTLVEQSS